MEAGQKPLFLVRAGHGGPVVRSEPNPTATPLSGLYYDTYLPVYARIIDASGVLWYQVRLWGTLSGWIRVDQTETGNPPTPTATPASSSSGASSASTTPPSPSGVFSLSAHGVTDDLVNLRTGASIEDDQIEVLPRGTPFTVNAWQTDEDADAWYRVSAAGKTGWVWSGAVSLLSPNPAKVSVDGTPIWAPITGKGMWMPSPLLEMANPEAVVDAAKDLGLSHIYLEVGDSSGGFYDREGVDRLLPVAHKSGIKVIGWVLTSLDDIPTDVSLCTTIANYRTPSGDRLDGLAPDVEFNMDPADVAAFSQILRAKLGPDRLIVGVIYPAGTWIGQQHPVAGILARSFNALAPMDYWHESQKTYSAATVSEFVRLSIVDIHEAVDDPEYPVTVIGQTYDSFGRDGIGPDNPTAAEISAALEEAKQAGAVGVSFFQWGTTTPAEWDALRAFAWK